jgi:hypothetical protein
MTLLSLKLNKYNRSYHGASFLKTKWVCPLSDVLVFEEYCLLGCDAVKSDKSRGSAFLRNGRQTCTRLHTISSLNASVEKREGKKSVKYLGINRGTILKWMLSSRPDLTGSEYCPAVGFYQHGDEHESWRRALTESKPCIQLL